MLIGPNQQFGFLCVILSVILYKTSVCNTKRYQMVNMTYNPVEDKKSKLLRYSEILLDCSLVIS